MPIGVTMLAATLAFGGVLVGKMKIARARARVRRRLAVEVTSFDAVKVGALVKVVGRVRVPRPCEAPLSARRCAVWEVALRPGRGPKPTLALHGGGDFELVGDCGRVLKIRWDPEAELLFGPDLGFRYTRTSARRDRRAGAVRAMLEWTRRPVVAPPCAALESEALPDVAGFQRRFAAVFGSVDGLMLPPKRGALAGEERLLVAGQRVALLGVVVGDGDGFALVGTDVARLAISSTGDLESPDLRCPGYDVGEDPSDT